MILDYSDEGIADCLNNAEEYLCLVVSKTANKKTFDELRCWSYCWVLTKNCLVENLPPTSNSIKLHILRAFYVVNTQLNCLNSYATALDPQ